MVMDAVCKHHAHGRDINMCLRCLLVVDENGDPDKDYYSARQYFAFMSIPAASRCKHQRETPDKKQPIFVKLEEIMKLVRELNIS